MDIVGIAVRRAGRDRSDLGLDPALFTTDAEDLVTRADVVVEVIGGIEPARSLILRAMEHGASVVTANKALLAQDGPTLYAAAQDAGVDLYYEAAVAGAIPLLRPLRESLAGDDVRRVLGIVNGTTNYVLDKMDSTGAGFHDAVEQAQALGLRRGRPDRRRRGLRRRRQGRDPRVAGLPHPGLRRRRPPRGHHRGDRRRRGRGQARWTRVVKLLAICERTDAEGVSVRVHPAMIPRSHPLAGVREAFNAVFVEADAAGQLMFYGRGAGGDPTASRGPRRRGRRRPAPGRRRPRTGRERRTPTCRSCRWARPRRGTTSASTWRTGRACSPRWRRPSPTTSVSIETVRQQIVPAADEETGPTAAPASSSSRIPRPTRRCSATVEALAGLADRPRGRLGHARRGVLTWPTSGAA